MRWTERNATHPEILSYINRVAGRFDLRKYITFNTRSARARYIENSAQWPKAKVELCGRRLAIIGTGWSGVQMTPVIAEEAAQLTVFQRTANYSIPAANAPVSDEEHAEAKAAHRECRQVARNSPSGLGFVP